MNDQEASDILRAQGYAVSAPDLHTGRVRLWPRDGSDGVEVQAGRELHDLAEGRLTLDDVRAIRDKEILAWSE